MSYGNRGSSDASFGKQFTSSLKKNLHHSSDKANKNAASSDQDSRSANTKDASGKKPSTGKGKERAIPDKPAPQHAQTTESNSKHSSSEQSGQPDGSNMCGCETTPEERAHNLERYVYARKLTDDNGQPDGGFSLLLNGYWPKVPGRPWVFDGVQAPNVHDTGNRPTD